MNHRRYIQELKNEWQRDELTLFSLSLNLHANSHFIIREFNGTDLIATSHKIMTCSMMLETTWNFQLKMLTIIIFS